MLQRTCTLVSSAVMLSMVGAFGAQSRPNATCAHNSTATTVKTPGSSHCGWDPEARVEFAVT